MNVDGERLPSVYCEVCAEELHGRTLLCEAHWEMLSSAVQKAVARYPVGTPQYQHTAEFAVRTVRGMLKRSDKIVRQFEKGAVHANDTFF